MPELVKHLVAPEEAVPAAKGAQEPRRPSQPRLHFLDWLRTLMVLGVVFAHTAMSGLDGGGAFNEAFRLDDRTLYYDPDFQDAIRGTSLDKGGPSPHSVRWISVIRQWCLPLLFWVSGAAVGCSYRGGVVGGLVKMMGFSAIGMALNAALWFLSPRNPNCYLANIDLPECQGRGVLFDFSICGRAGAWFAVVFQMWYTVALSIFTLLSWPTFAVAHDGARPLWLILQWLGTVAFYLLLMMTAGDKCDSPLLVVAVSAALEAAFLALVALDAPPPGPTGSGAAARSQDRWLPRIPVRLLHYLMAALVIGQMGALPYMVESKHISTAYLAYMGTGFHKFFQLGFLLTLARRGGRLSPGTDRVQPLASSVWPACLVLIAVVAPSTNWSVSGMLTYPYYSSAQERCFYVAGSIVAMFVVDRASRGLECVALPGMLAWASLLLYLGHPWLITLLLAWGLRSVLSVWVVCALAGLVAAVGVELAGRVRKPGQGPKKVVSDSSEQDGTGEEEGGEETEDESGEAQAAGG